jgi:hypothetical protein
MVALVDAVGGRWVLVLVGHARVVPARAARSIGSRITQVTRL